MQGYTSKQQQLKVGQNPKQCTITRI